MGQLTVNVPGTPKDESIEVPPFGLVPNGSTIKLTDDQMEAYDLYMQYLSGDPDYEIDEDIVVGDPDAELPPPLPKEVEEDEDEDKLPVEAPPKPGPVSTPAKPEPKDGE
jgi:hypothetical protein